jgi:hypothetical protein
MNTWIEEAIRILGLMVRKPDTPLEIAVTSVLVIALFLTIMWLAGLAFKMPDTNLMQRILSGILVFVVGLAAATAASILAAPRVEKEIVHKAILISAPILGLLAIGVPLAMLTMRAKYFQTLFTVSLSIAAAWGVALLSENIFDSVRAGAKQAGKASDRKDEINKVIDSAGAKTSNAAPQRVVVRRNARDIANQKRDAERAAEQKAAREKALREGL